MGFTKSTNRKIELVQEEKNQCLEELQISQTSSLDEITNLKEVYRNKEEENLAVKVNLEERIESLTNKYEKQIDELKNMNSELNTALQIENREKAAMEEDKLSLTDANIELQNKLTEVTKELDIHKSDKITLNEEKRSLTNDLDTLNIELSKTFKELEGAKTEIELCNKEKNQKSQEVKTLNDQTNTFTENLTKMEIEKQDMIKKLSEVESENNETSKKIT